MSSLNTGFLLLSPSLSRRPTVPPAPVRVECELGPRFWDFIKARSGFPRGLVSLRSAQGLSLSGRLSDS